MSNDRNYIHAITGEPRGWRYGSDLALYTERFIDGRLLCAAYQDNGTPVYAQHELRDRFAFDLVVDGESLTFGWEVAGFAAQPGPNGVVSATLSLRHTRKPIELDVCTDACGFGFFRRSLRLRNTSRTEALRLASVSPLCGALWGAGDALKDNLRDRSVVPYSVGHFRDVEWGNEGNFTWQDLPVSTEVAYVGEQGKSGWSSPFFVLRNNLFGGYLTCHLAWSGNWRMCFYPEHNPNAGSVIVRFAIMPAAIPAMRVIAPGESVTTPEVHFGLNHDDFDAAIQNLHSHLRANVLRKVGDGRQPVIDNHWSYMEHEVGEERLRAEIDMAAAVGAELFMVDAGWYRRRRQAWSDTSGDWQAGNRLPNDLFPVFDYARQKGLHCGLWVEIESAGKASKLAAEHPGLVHHPLRPDRWTASSIWPSPRCARLRRIARSSGSSSATGSTCSGSTTTSTPREGGFNLVRRPAGEHALAPRRGDVCHLRHGAGALPESAARELLQRRRPHGPRHEQPLHHHLDVRLDADAADGAHPERHEHGPAARIHRPALRRLHGRQLSRQSRNPDARRSCWPIRRSSGLTPISGGGQSRACWTGEEVRRHLQGLHPALPPRGARLPPHAGDSGRRRRPAGAHSST